MASPSPPRASALERRVTVVAVVTPFLGFLVALWLLWGGLVTGRDLAILAVAYVLVGFGVTVGFHRMLTHRSFEAKPWLRATLAILGSMSIQGAVIHWVADHRRHHTFTDEEGDPHSPHTHGGEGWRGVVRGLWHSHMGWLFDHEPSSAKRYAPDLRKDPLIRWVDKLFPVWALLGLALPFVAGFALSGGELAAGLTAFVWAGLVRVFLLHHATWSVNSICHMYGSHPFAIADHSRDNWLVALVALGEGWHHSHHAFPTSARHGLRRFHFDPSYAVIRGLERLGLVWNVKRPKPEQIEAKLVGATAAPAVTAQAAACCTPTRSGARSSPPSRSSPSRPRARRARRPSSTGWRSAPCSARARPTTGGGATRAGARSCAGSTTRRSSCSSPRATHPWRSSRSTRPWAPSCS